MLEVDEKTKKRVKRGILRRRKNAVTLGGRADLQIEQLLIRRFERLISVRRFIFLWVSLFIILIFLGAYQLRDLSTYYQSQQPIPGGIYHEGIVGTFTNSNPLFAAGTANTAVSRLVFSGLFKYNVNNKLVGDLATGWNLNEQQTTYIVGLKNDITWQDGTKFTADDVVFTYKAIQDPETQSVLYANWKDIKVTKLNDFAVIFELPNSLSSFPYALTDGIIPNHLLKDTPHTQLRSATFNASPVGTGPFEWRFVETIGTGTPQREQRISLTPFEKYWEGRPKLNGFNLLAFTDEQYLLAAFKKKQLNAMSGLENLPKDLAKDSSIKTYNTPLTSTIMAFFNNSKPIYDDVNVRKALVAGVERNKVIELFSFPVKLANSPLLPAQLGYDPTLTQIPYNFDQANKLLDTAGWVKDENGQRQKNGKPLVINMRAQETQEYTKVADFLQREWQKLGAKVAIQYHTSEDLQSLVIANHEYEVLLYGISLGVDPDVYAYWDSSQASVGSQGRLNLSEYKSAAADQAIESARTRADQATRTIKYKAFLTEWVKDAPALALYQPNSLYVARNVVFNYERKSSNSSADRFYNVHQWMIRQQKQKIL
ncbi:peptide ABC transporter substrate-binding protein [Candidatus Saccharibacteria bacterium]|nr:peptide ABC transporter substrate-binding protein [Candidatus Saccharibacteria bacterium]